MAEARLAFLLSLSDRLRNLADPESIEHEAACALGEFVGANRAGYAEVHDDGATLVIGQHYRRDLPGIEGRYSAEDYGMIQVGALGAGRTVVREDVQADPELTAETKARYAEMGIAAHATVPLLKAGRLVAILFVHFCAPRSWTPRDIALLEDVAARTWDAVQRAHAVHALQVSESKYRSLFENVNEGFALCELVRDTGGRPHDFRVRQVNPAIERHSGLRADQVVGHYIRDLFPRVIPEHLASYTRMVDEGTPVAHETWVAERGRWLSVRAFPQSTERYAFLFADVTQRKQVEEDLRAADRRKDEFLATLAHELRNPLAPLRTAAHVLNAPDLPERHRRDARAMIERQVATMTRLVDDLLDISRVTLGRIELQREPVSIGVAVQQAIEAATPVITSRGHRLLVELPEHAPWVSADLTRLAQILTNLLTNAAKYTPPGGTVSVRAEADAHRVIVRVRDTGIGIPPDMTSRVFEMFAQVPRAAAMSQGGLGIGLALAKRLVEMHEGSIEVSSEGEGRGSEFSICLPRIPDPREGSASERSARKNGSGHVKLLVVDDNEDAANSLAMLLDLLGHDVTVVYSGEDALSALAGTRFDAVVLDIGLPQMDGYEVARRIREARGSGAPLLVALTGWGQQADRARAARAGFDAHLTKPADPDELAQILSERLVPGAAALRH